VPLRNVPSRVWIDQSGVASGDTLTLAVNCRSTSFPTNTIKMNENTRRTNQFLPSGGPARASSTRPSRRSVHPTLQSFNERKFRLIHRDREVAKSAGIRWRPGRVGLRTDANRGLAPRG